MPGPLDALKSLGPSRWSATPAYEEGDPNKPKPGWMDNLAGAMQGMAYPQTAQDIFQLATAGASNNIGGALNGLKRLTGWGAKTDSALSATSSLAPQKPQVALGAASRANVAPAYPQPPPPVLTGPNPFEAANELARPGAQKYMNDQFARNNPLAQKILGRDRVGGPPPASAPPIVPPPPPPSPTATFLGHGPDGPLYNIQGGAGNRSTVSPATLKAQGIEIPVTPTGTGAPRLNGDQIRAQLLKERAGRAPQLDMAIPETPTRGGVPREKVDPMRDQLLAARAWKTQK